MWENRYGLLKPVRSEGNTRYYDEQEVKKLMMAAHLNKQGLRISRIAVMSEEELGIATREFETTNNSFSQLIDLFLIYSVQFNEPELVRLFNQVLEQYGLEKTFRLIIFPMLQKIGVLWLSGKITPGHEHFFSNLCRQKLFAEIDRLPAKPANRPHVVLFLPFWDLHELSILFYSYLLKKNGYPCTYLGQAVPANDATETIFATQATMAICSFITAASEEDVEAYLFPIAEKSGNTCFYITGPQLVSAPKHERIIVFETIEDLKILIGLQ